MPVGRLRTPSERPQATIGSVGRAALLPATVALDVPSEMAAIDPSNSEAGTVTRASAIGTSGRSSLISTEVPAAAAPEPLPPTPLLDAALVRARSQANPPAEPVPLAATPAPLVEAPVVPTPEPMPLIAPPTAPVAAPEPKPPAVETVEATPVAPEELWRDGVRKLAGLARSQREQAGEGGTEPWGLRTRVLAWLAEPDIDPDLGGRDADGVRAVLRALEAPRPGDSHPRGDDVRAAISMLEAKAPLELVNLQICQSVERFGEFTLFRSPTHRAGDWIGLYCEVDGLHQEPTATGFQARLGGQLEIMPLGGGPTVALPLLTSNQTFPRRRRDYYVSYSKALPRDLAPGAYTLRVTLRDLGTDQTASRETTLLIGGDGGPDDVSPAPHPADPAP